MPYFLHAWEWLASANQKLMLMLLPFIASALRLHTPRGDTAPIKIGLVAYVTLKAFPKASSATQHLIPLSGNHGNICILRSLIGCI